MAESNKGLDLLGVQPVAESVKSVTDGAVNGASAFLSRICLPAAEEFGLLLRDRVSAWRAKNAVHIAMKAQELLKDQMQHVVLHAHPRIIYETIEKGSWAEDSSMQSMWAGLLASSCTANGKDESNLIFIHILSILTSSQAKIISYACNNATIYKSRGGWIAANNIEIELSPLMEISGVNDEHQLDHELDHLRGLELLTINSGFHPDSKSATIAPSALGLQFYARAQGFVGSPFVFYNISDSGVEGP